MWDELDEPLGLASGVAAPPVRRKRPTKGAAIGATLLAIVVGLLTLPRLDSSLNGEPFAVAKVEVAPAPQKPEAPDVTASVRRTTSPTAAPATQVEATSEVKVTRGSSGPPKPLIIDVAQALGVKLAAAPDARLIERSEYGLLPRIGVDGARPIDVYARAVISDPILGSGRPRIALVVGGLGLNAEGADNAIAKLPGDVTLGFAPNGEAVEQQAARARDAGHETVLQARLANFSDAAGDAGSHVLRTSASELEDLDALRWQMGRFTGYVAVVTDSGGKLMDDRQKMAPVLKEIAARGLGYLDGASPRGGALDSSATLATPSARGDVVINANATPEAIDAALTRLVALARQRGSAIGIASATPGSVERLARWANGLDLKGVALVPLSALLAETPRLSPQSNLSARP